MGNWVAENYLYTFILKGSIRAPEIGENIALPINPNLFWKPKSPRSWLTKTIEAPPHSNVTQAQVIVLDSLFSLTRKDN